MKTRKPWLVAIGATIAMSAHADTYAASKAAPQSRAAGSDVIASFFAACAAQDEQRLRELATDDLRIEYALETPGVYYTLDSLALGSECAALDELSSDSASVQVFPTADEQAVFVRYELDGKLDLADSPQQLALVELRGTRIARILNFSTPAHVMLSNRERTQSHKAAMLSKDAR